MCNDKYCKFKCKNPNYNYCVAVYYYGGVASFPSDGQVRNDSINSQLPNSSMLVLIDDITASGP